MVRTIKKIIHSLIQALWRDLSFIKKQTFSILIQIEWNKLKFKVVTLFGRLVFILQFKFELVYELANLIHLSLLKY